MIKRPTPPPINTDVVIIGAGVSGLTLAEALMKRGIDFWLLGSPYESQLAKAGELTEETPLPDGTVGLKFIEQWLERLSSSDFNHRTSLSTGIEIEDNQFKVKTKYQDFVTQKIVIATGCKQKKLGFTGEDQFLRKGISDCAVCDFPLFRQKRLAVVGNHEYTKRAAVFLRKHTDQISLLWYEGENAPSVEGVQVYDKVTEVEVSGEETVEQITFISDGQSIRLDVDGVFVEGEPVPSTAFLVDSSIELKNGFVKVDDNYRTNIENIWAIGDVTGKSDNYQGATNQAERLVSLVFD